MADSLRLTELIGEGRFKEALRVLGTPLPSDLTAAVARAQLLLHVGNARVAARVARRLMRLAGHKRTIAACHMVLGGVHRNNGQLKEACERFQNGIRLADAAGDNEQSCWGHLRLMAAIAEAYGSEVAYGVLPDVRRKVFALGEPHALCALHVFLAEIETKRGHLDDAVRHLCAAESILKYAPNYWLEGLAALATLCVAYLKCDADEAGREAHRALRCATTSGHAVTRMAALSNLGHICLLRGELENAYSWLDHAQKDWRQGGGGEVAILDGLAQVQLAGNNRDECERCLSRAFPEETPFAGASYYQAWTIPTRIRLLLSTDHAERAVDLATRGIQLGRDRAMPALVYTVELLRANAMVELGRLREAAESVLAAGDSTGLPVSATPAHVDRLVARLHAADGHRREAAFWFERSSRLLASASDECSRAEVLDDYADFLWPTVGSGEKQAADDRTLPPAVRPPIAHVSVHPDAATLLAPGVSADDSTPLEVLHRAAGLVDLRGRPLALAVETFELLRAVPGVRAAAIVLRPERGDANIVRFAGHWGDARGLTADGQAERIAVGPWRDGTVEVLVETGDDLAARCALVAVKRLVRGAVALEIAERERRERVALWPVEDTATAGQVFASPLMLELLATARKVAPSTATVLLTGESGTGKEVLARIIHDASPRSNKPFVPFNCTAVPRDMLDSQLFGYRRGAFTGAAASFPGVIRSAAGGTLLLDEIGEISLELQPKLLRFLDAQEIQPLGEPHPLKVDARVIAATNANLDQLVAAGRFREDLYYRLNVVPLKIPPLRERREEIPVLAAHFLDRFAGEYGKQNLRLAEETMEYLLLYRWPGNVRELLNQMRRLAALAENGAVLMPEHLATEITAARRTVPASQRVLATTEVVVRLDQPLAAAVEHLERAMLPYAARTAKGHMETAARMLGLSRKGLYLKRQRLGLDRSDALRDDGDGLAEDDE